MSRGSSVRQEQARLTAAIWEPSQHIASREARSCRLVTPGGFIRSGPEQLQRTWNAS